MPVKIIVDMSGATEEEIEQYASVAREVPALQMLNNARKHDLEFIQLMDNPTAANYYAKQTFPTSDVAIIDFTKPVESRSIGPDDVAS